METGGIQTGALLHYHEICAEFGTSGWIGFFLSGNIMSVTILNIGNHNIFMVGFYSYLFRFLLHICYQIDLLIVDTNVKCQAVLELEMVLRKYFGLNPTCEK